MTRNQIEYWRNVETNRANTAREQETIRSNLAQENEIHRSNLATEAETNRHNLATEQLTATRNANDLLATQYANAHNRRTLSETVRSNKAREDETSRSNMARELENTRSRVESNQIRRREASTADYSARTNRMNAELRSHELYEAVRSHQANEAYNLGLLSETQRANRARELEINRSNLVREGQNYQSQVLSKQSLEENKRHNIASENINSRGQVINLIGTLGSSMIRSAGGLQFIGGKIG